MTPDEIIITRNTSESNNLVSNGLDLKAWRRGHRLSDNHPSNLHGMAAKGESALASPVVTIEQKNPHPGHDVLRRGVHARDHAAHEGARLHACLEHRSATCMPAKRALPGRARARSAVARRRRAQSFGLLDVNLADMQPDFYSGSAHKWPCGAVRVGVLFVNKTAQARLWPSIYSAYPGAVGFSRTFEGFGQRDEATMIAFRAALAFQETVGRAAIEQRARDLTSQLMAGLSKLPGIKMWTSPAPERRVAIVSFLPGSLDANKLATALYEKDKIAIATRGGQDRAGLRVSPHFYNSPAEVERLLAALTGYLKTGV